MSVPVPDKFTVCGLFAALSEMTSVPVLLPAAVGVNVTLIVQLAETANVDPHVLATAKGPVDLIEAMVSCALPLLVSDIGCGELVVPTN